MKKAFILLLLVCIWYGATAQQKSIVIKIRNFGVWVKGSFSEPKGEIRFDPLSPSDALFDVVVDANSIKTGIDLRDNHLRKKEYLDVEKYPQIKFTSSSVVKGDEPNAWIVTGYLTIKEVRREISFPFSTRQGDGYGILTAEFVINRKDFTVGGKSLSMADELTVILNVRN